MTTPIKKVFTKIRKEIEALAEKYPRHTDLIKTEIQSLNRLLRVSPGRRQTRNTRQRHRPFYDAGDQARDNVQNRGVVTTDVDDDAFSQSAMTDTVNEIVQANYENPITVKAKADGKDGAGKAESEEHSSRQDGANLKVVGEAARPVFSRLASTETTIEGQKRQRDAYEDSLATGECASSAAVPYLEISTTGLSKQHSSYSSPISLSDSSPQTPHYTTWDKESEMLIRNWLRQRNFRDLLKAAHQLPDNALFKLPRRREDVFTLVNKALAEKILTELQPGKCLTDESVNYFLSRIAAENGVQLLNSFWYPRSVSNLRTPAGRLDLAPGTRTLIPCFDNIHWSCIEVDQEAHKITHYDSMRGMHCKYTSGWVRDPPCVYCKQVGDNFSHALTSLANVQWQYRAGQCQQQNNATDCAVFMLANLEARAQELDTSQGLSTDTYRLNMGILFIRDLLAGKATGDMVQAMSSDTKKVSFEWVEESTSRDNEGETPLETEEEERWAQFEATHKSKGWLHQLARITLEWDSDITGFQSSSRFLQLAANVASPLTLIDVKWQLAELRRRQPKPRVSSNHLQGAYFAGVWHENNKLRSSICARLISWVFRNEVAQRMVKEKRSTRKRQKRGKNSTEDRGEYQTAKKKAIESLVREISLLDHEAGQGGAITRCPPAPSLSADDPTTTVNVDEATADEMKRRIDTWYRVGGPWSRLATAAGSPSFLCLLPSGTNLLPGGPPIYASEYRDLSASQANDLGKILSALRPHINGLFPKELYEAFLRSSPPSRRFQIEDWPDDWIRSQPLDSDELARAFELRPEDLTQ